MSTEASRTSPLPGGRGVCVWLTGRSGAGKTTVTDALVQRLEAEGRVVTVLDTVPLLAKGRGERTSEGKLLRKAFVAAEVVRHGGVVVCVTVSARRSVRERARSIVGDDGFVEVYFDVPAEVARARRRRRGSRRSLRKAAKRLLRRAAATLRRGPPSAYEPSEMPEVTIDAMNQTPEESARQIFDHLVARGFLGAAA